MTRVGVPFDGDIPLDGWVLLHDPARVGQDEWSVWTCVGRGLYSVKVNWFGKVFDRSLASSFTSPERFNAFDMTEAEAQAAMMLAHHTNPEGWRRWCNRWTGVHDNA